jgi:hypothetical protein
MWNQMLESQEQGVIAKDRAGTENLAVFPIKYLRSAVCSGRMDGERLESFNRWFTGGYNAKESFAGQSDYFKNHSSQYADIAKSFLEGMTAPQLATLKTGTIKQLNNMMLTIDEGNGIDDWTMVNGVRMSNKVLHYLETQIQQLNTERSMAAIRTGMNPDVRKMLGINDFISTNNGGTNP